ncbi:FG-GAP repeat protein [Anabaena sp. FACHB-1391]|uniref:DUF4114 domain-containing protein n=1 Tax=Anabaena sp. FACHB-1391 TaxID=2692771 RepID=UPI001680C024|nr:DUF4114 domain-containing protein [Anabaena sp. FACHB-1391]MBD2267727.1 FG-GAP repeat protein [Anabaena sp. FACHB-1391]
MSAQFFDLSTLDGKNGFIISAERDDNLGYSVSDAGDINGDGIGDLVIGSPLSDPDDKSNAGVTYLLFGSKEGFDLTLNPSTLGTKGFVINGAQAGDQSGRSVSNIGDINGDGVDDLAIGAPFSGINGDNSGAAYIIFGSKQSDYFSNPIELSDLGSKGLTIKGSNSGHNAGWAVSSAGDFNGDGTKDLLIGATNPSDNENGIDGESYVIFGKEGGFSSTIDLSNIGLNDGLKIISDDLNNLGYSVSDAGDINKDGIDDLIIGAPYADPNGNNSGSSYVIYGRRIDTENPITDNTINVSLLDSNNNSNNDFTGFTINGQDKDQSGFFVSKAGDINGDGIADLIIGARDGNPNNKEFAGRAYVVFCKEGDISDNFNLSDLNGSNGFTINGIAAFDNAGWSVSNLGDINDDGIDDIIIGANNANNSYGQSYVIYGNRDGFSSTFELSNLDGTNGFIISGIAVNGNLGHSVSGAGDVNGDGVNDFIISAPFANSGAGAAYVVFGTPVNEAPTGLSLSNDRVNENVPDNTVVGSLITTDPDTEDSFTYSLVTGEGDDDNSAFTIDGDQLKINLSPDFETKSSYKIRVKTQDAAGLTYEKALTVNINDINETDSNSFLTLISGDVFKIEDNNSNGNATLEFTLTGSNSDGVNEIGVFTVDDASGKIDGIATGEQGYTEKALARGQVIFSTLTNSPSGFDDNSLKRLLLFNTNDNLRFYLVKDGSTDSVLNKTTPMENVLIANSSNLKITDLGSNSFSLEWEDGSGDPTGFEDLRVNIQVTNQAIALGTNLQSQPQGESLDLRNIRGDVKADFTVYREANYNNFVGFYQVTGENGGIDTNGDGQADILPGEAGYIQAAINKRISDINLSVTNGGTATSSATIPSGSIVVPFLIVNGTPDALLDSNSNNDPDIYFTFLGANSDGVDHVRMLGDNTFGFEDMSDSGDKDFNDIIVKVNLTPVV